MSRENPTGADPLKALLRERDLESLKKRFLGECLLRLQTLEGQVENYGGRLAFLEKRIEVLGVSENVIFTGFVQDSDLLHLYNGAEVVVVPSYDEGFGLPALEAMACGTPVVASYAGALPEVVGEAGRFFNPYASEELANHLQELLEHESLRRELGRKGLRRAQQFSWEGSARSALATFEELVKERESTDA